MADKVPVLGEGGVRMVSEADFNAWLDENPTKRPQGWTAENQRDAINTLGGSANLSAEDYVEYAGLKGVDLYDVLNDVMLAYGDAEQNTDEVEMEREIGAFLSREREQEASAQIPPDLSSELPFMSPEERQRQYETLQEARDQLAQEFHQLPDTPYQQSQQRTQAAARKAFNPPKTTPKRSPEEAIEKQFVDAARENEPYEQVKYVEDQVTSKTPGYGMLSGVGEAVRSGQELERRSQRRRFERPDMTTPTE